MLVTVKRVIDGDTFETEDGKFVRLSRFDAPELHEAGGKEMTAHLRQLIAGKDVRIEQVGISYGRLVAEVWLDDISVNYEMGWYLEELEGKKG